MQTTLAFPSTWGGWRPGAGRPRSEHAGVPHSARPPLASRFPVHVTLRLRPGLPSLRRPGTHRALRGALRAGCERFGFRLVHYSAQSNHVHILAEATGRRALARGVQGLCVRIAKRLNRALGRRGPVFADRYHDRILRTPSEVRRALIYVLKNAWRHGVRLAGALDPFSSASWFDGWRGGPVALLNAPARPVAPAGTWLLAAGWRRGGLIRSDERPAGAT